MHGVPDEKDVYKNYVIIPYKTLLIPRLVMTLSSMFLWLLTDLAKSAKC